MIGDDSELAVGRCRFHPRPEVRTDFLHILGRRRVEGEPPPPPLEAWRRRVVKHLARAKRMPAATTEANTIPAISPADGVEPSPSEVVVVEFGGAVGAERGMRRRERLKLWTLIVVTYLVHL